MSYNEQLLKHVDAYGYPLPPGRRWKLRRRAIDSSKSITAGLITALLSVIGTLLLLGRLGRRYTPLTPRSFHPRRILLIRLDLIGDLTLSLTMARALKRAYPEAQIDLLALPSSAPVARFDPHITEIIPYDPNVWRRPRSLLQPKRWRQLFALLKKLRACRYDLAVSVYGPWAATLAVLSDARRRVGYGSESYPGFMTDSVPGGVPGRWQHGAQLDNRHEVDYCLGLARAVGATITPEDRIPRLYVDEQTRQETEQLLLEAGIQAGKPLVVCHINSNNGQSKRWPIPYWATLIDRLICQVGATVVLSGAPNDLPQVESVMQKTRERAINLAGKTSLTQLIALLQRADLLISGDSGPLHMGVACDTPIIGIYGPTNPALNGPVSPDATILHSDIWCSPCYTGRAPADCRFYTTQCMKNILPAQVFAAAQQKLAQQQPHADTIGR
jgi:lipopolysaccharide heptosyltransferase II